MNEVEGMQKTPRRRRDVLLLHIADPGDLVWITPVVQRTKVEADVQLARIEGNDCDVHLEISERGAGKNGDRMIVEIPADVSPGARKTLLDAVHVDLTEVPKYEPDPPLKITVTGYGFWDGAHYSPANPKQGHLHGSANVKNLWELHPVSKLVVTP